MNAAKIAVALGDGQREGRGWRCRCPVHGRVSLNIADSPSGKLLVTCWAGCDPLKVLTELRRLGLLDDRANDDRPIYPTRPTVRRIATRSTEARASAIWRETVPAPGTLAETYLVGRALSLPPRHDEVLRFHPACPFKGAKVPALVALFRDIATDKPCGIHRTALLPDGRDRDRVKGRAMLGRAAGAAIKISPADEVELGLGLAEGIETGLAVIGFGWSPIWACASAGGVAAFPVLPGIEELTVFADRDPNNAGQKAAHTCAQRWSNAGVAAAARLPHGIKADWCDVAGGHG